MTGDREALWATMTDSERRIYVIAVFHTIADVFAMIHAVIRSGDRDHELCDLRERLHDHKDELSAEFAAKGVLQ